MENKELISQIAEMMEQQTQGLIKYVDEKFVEQSKSVDGKFEEQSKRVDEKFEEQSKRMDEKLSEHTQELVAYIDLRLEDHTRRIEIKIENEVTHKIEALFDGYKLTHEKQWELERKVDSLARAVEDLQIRIA